MSQPDLKNVSEYVAEAARRTWWRGWAWGLGLGVIVGAIAAVSLVRGSHQLDQLAKDTGHAVEQALNGIVIVLAVGAVIVAGLAAWKAHRCPHCGRHPWEHKEAP